MICQACKLAGNHNTDENYERAIERHEECEGDCGCQHKIGPAWFVKANEKAPLIQVQSP